MRTMIDRSMPPPAASDPAPPSGLGAKLDEAWRRFRLACFWSMSRTAAPESIVKALRENGGMDAWRLASEIEREMRRKESNAA